MTASDRFILSLLPPPAGRRAVLEAITKESRFSWPEVEAHAVAWGLAPLVHYRLAESGLLAAAPPKMKDHLAEIRRYTAIRNSLVDRTLESLLVEFSAADLPVILLKGADLSRTAYPRPDLRISLDLDLLVPRDDVNPAEALLRQRGYEPAALMERDWFDDNLHHGIPWKSADGAVTIELHWTLVRRSDPFVADPPLLWSRARPIAVRRAGALRLSAEDNAEYLAVHFFRHITAPDGALRSLADLVLLLDAAEGRAIDWPEVKSGARKRGTSLPLALALGAIRSFWPGRHLEELVAEFESDVPDRKALALSRKLYQDLFSLPTQQPPAIVSGFTRLGQERGLGRKIRFLVRGLLPPPEEMNRDLSPGQGRLPFLFRYPALAFNYARELVKIGPRAARAAYRSGTLSSRMSGAVRRDKPDS